MKHKIFLFSLLSVLMLAFGCNDDDLPFSDCFQEANGKAQFTITPLDGPTTSLPSKVSMFFKVTDEDGDPVGYLNEDNFIIYEKGINDDCHREIGLESDRKIKTDPQIFNHTTMLVLDLSGSVLENHLDPLLNAGIEFIDAIMPDTVSASKSMGIWWFDGEDILHSLVPPTGNKNTLKLGLLAIDQSISNDNSTDLYGAILKSADIATNLLNMVSDSVIGAVSVVIFTDGTDKAARYLKSEAITAIHSLPQEISYFTIGIGVEADNEVLSQIGRNGFVSDDDVGQLANIFESVANLVSAEANSYYQFEYCSPKRSGTSNGLIIEVFHNGAGGKFGNFKTTFDATGFTGGCSL